MNKDLIKKYKAEFDHWMNGGAIQAFYKNDNEPKWWYCDNFSHIISKSLGLDDVIIVIDDEYIEFRKALVEGKAIECLNWDDNWRDLIENNIKFENIDLSRLRIKPVEPKFKEGDWVIDKVNGKVVQLTEHFQPGGIELWKPKNNEYFWYKNDLVKFDETQTNAGLLLQSVRGCSYYPSENFEDFCEPFIGKLPSNLK